MMSPSISDPQNRSVELPTHFDDYDVDGDPNHRDVLEGVMEMVNRLRARESVESAPPRAKAFENYDGDVIAYEDLVVKEKIGHGGFGDVHVALWNGSNLKWLYLYSSSLSRSMGDKGWSDKG